MNASDRRDERGSALPLVLVAALALFAVLAFSVDQGIAYAAKASVWFYETPEESVSSTERHWVVGMQFEEESPTVFARGYGIEGLPVASYRVLTAMPYAGEKVWRPETRRCGRYDYPAGATADSWTYEALNSLDAFPAELAEAARATLAESGK